MRTKPNIPAGKARYSLTLTKENVNEFRLLAKQFRMPASQLSVSVDDFLKEMNATMRRCYEKGSVTLTDLFTMVGHNIEAAMKEESDAQKRKEAEKKGTGN